VWTDLFQHVDRLIDGDRNAQMKLAKAPWGPAKITRRLVKWSIYLLISISTGGAWIFYFADAPTLAREFVTLQAPSIAYSTVFVLTVTTMWFGGFMREQVCIYMCPWPRIQSAMLDEKSLLVTYKDWRGEPRGKKAADGKPLGDCVDCGLCAAVCPTGIDIREGPQIGCITCALCIDACDGVMEKTGRPRGLIDYVTLEDAARKRATRHAALEADLACAHADLPRHLVGHWRGSALALGTRQHLSIAVSKDRNPPYMILSSGDIRNAYAVRWKNMEARPRKMQLVLDGPAGAKMWSEDMSKEMAARDLTRIIPADSTAPLRIYVTAPAGTPEGKLSFTARAGSGWRSGQL
jgi:cytochrome c oxidase accessory protein FixG